MNASVHFSKIKDEILIANLKRATSSIRIAVAWFTDEDIIRVLSQRKAAGINVEVIISNRIENFTNPDNFKDYLRQNARLFVCTKTFLHHKFCIIDNTTILNGSYNWSYAARKNEENILVISLQSDLKEDNDLLKKFETKYIYLRDRCSEHINDLNELNARKTGSVDFALRQSQMDKEEIILRKQFENEIRSNMNMARAAGITISKNIMERMAIDGDGVEFVKRLLHDEMTSGDMKSGFKKLEEHIPHKVDLSFEYLVSRPRYEKLFRPEEIQFCKNLMQKYNL